MTESLLRTVTLSVATTPLLEPAEAEPLTIGTRIGVGVRATLVGGRPNPRMSSDLAELDRVNREILDELDKPAPDKAVLQKLTAQASKVAFGDSGPESAARRVIRHRGSGSSVEFSRRRRQPA